MEEQLNELNEIIELIKQNIEKINNIEYGDDYYYINHTFKEKEAKNFEIKQKEDIELNQIDKALKKLEYSKQKTNNSEKLKSLEKIINFYTTRRDLINNNRSNRLKELELLKQKRKEILEDEKYFYQTKQLVIDILNSFIYSINLNNFYYVLANYNNYNKFTAFIDNKSPIHPRVLEYFKSLGATIMYERCIFFESNLETLIKLLTTKNIEWILIINPNYKLESKLNQKKKN
mgnify:FL=1